MLKTQKNSVDHHNSSPSASVQGRYDSLRLISWWEQERVSKARVMVVGAGALGNEILKNLALVGIGHIVVIDFDVVEAANLTRSVLFRVEDIGQPKARVAAQRLKEINPDIQVAYLCGNISTEVGLGIFRDMDVVIVGVDNFAARIFVNRSCFKVGTPWINGGIQELMGEAHVYIPGKGACFECNLPPEAYQEINRRISCFQIEEIKQGRIPTTPTIASIIAGIQVQEALKLIHRKKVAGGSGLLFKGLNNEWLPLHFQLNEKCLSHNKFDSIRRLNKRASDITFGEILSVAGADLGSDVFIELDFDLVPRLTCTCGYKNDVIRRLDKFSTAADFRCPSCNKSLQPSMTSTVDSSTKELLEKTLAEAGVPPGHIVTARNTKSAIRFELCADKKEILDYT